MDCERPALVDSARRVWLAIAVLARIIPVSDLWTTGIILARTAFFAPMHALWPHLGAAGGWLIGSTN
jgi:hypothetical protein